LDRFSLYVPHGDSRRYLSAVYDLTHSGILFTDVEEDACAFVTIDKAVDVAKALHSLHGYDIGISVSSDAK
jgi:hypothetical protein